jgi:molybdopterin/thiamine biosynthesis adenylyltransferase/rhodanese-related sulfurtransferase
MVRFQEHLAAVKQQIVETTVDRIKATPPEVLIDVRELDEHNDGYIPGSIYIPRGKLELRIEDVVPQREATIVLYCAGGNRSALAAKTLGELGYRNVSSLAGGFTAWTQSGGAVEKPFVFSPDQRSRYSRHLMLSEVGERGQAKLLQARVLIIGAGGLGAPNALYLAAAGVGTLGVVDDDVVDASNLQRQIIHSTSTIGVPKVESAKRTIMALNPDVKVVTHQTRLSTGNVLEVMGDYDLIIDGTDNFQARYLINDASLMLRKPVISASIFQFEGQVTVFQPFAGPCYRCLYPEPPPPGMAPSCNEAGVLGVLPGVIGAVQATEAIKLLLGIGNSLVGRLLQYDALKLRFRELKLPRDPSCVVCSDAGKKIELIDYKAFCAQSPGDPRQRRDNAS